jgi:murein DD-endopeptidase MepM/ murein hydrolase activator NlpD
MNEVVLGLDSRTPEARESSAHDFDAEALIAAAEARVQTAAIEVVESPVMTRSERRARRMGVVSSTDSASTESQRRPQSASEDPRVAASAAEGSAASTPSRRARRAADSTVRVVEGAPADIVTDWAVSHTEHDLERSAGAAASLGAQPLGVAALGVASSSAVDTDGVLPTDAAPSSRRARRAREVVARETTVLDAAEALPVVTRRARRAVRTEDVPVLTFESRATLEPAPVAANPADLVIAEPSMQSESFTIVQDDPADVASHNAIVDEREAVTVMIEDVPVEPVIASVSPTVVLDPAEIPTARESVQPVVTEGTSSPAVVAAHVTEQLDRTVFVPRTELDPPKTATEPAIVAPIASVSRRGRVGRVAAKSFSVAAFTVAGLLTLATSVPANALLSADDVAAQKVLVTQGETSAGQTQTVAASGDTAIESVQRDSYGALSAIEAAKALGIQPEATFTNDPNGTIQWPFAVGVHIGSGYGARPGCPIGCSTNHQGQDFNPGYGAPIQSIADGVVIESSDSGGAFGVKIVIEHVIDGQIVHSLYGHMIYGSRTVEVGDTVTVGEVIGKTGNTGRSTGPHLHFEILLNGTEHVDPLAWLYANAN